MYRSRRNNISFETVIAAKDKALIVPMLVLSRETLRASKNVTHYDNMIRCRRGNQSNAVFREKNLAYQGHLLHSVHPLYVVLLHFSIFR